MGLFSFLRTLFARNILYPSFWVWDSVLQICNLDFLTFNFSDFENFPVLAWHYILSDADDFYAQWYRKRTRLNVSFLQIDGVFLNFRKTTMKVISAVNILITGYNSTNSIMSEEKYFVSHFRRNSLGVRPKCFLNTRVKCCGYSKPRSSEVSEMVFPSCR